MVGGRKRIIRQVGLWGIAAVAAIGLAAQTSAEDGIDALTVPQSTQDSVASAKSVGGGANDIVIDYATKTAFDLTPPATPNVSSPASQNAGAIEVTFSNATDTGSSGLAIAKLWMKPGSGGAWADTGIEYTFQGEETGGTMNYEGAGEGDYYFFVRLRDKAGNLSPEPQGDTEAHTVIDNSKPVIALNGPNVLVTEQGSAFNDPGATATDQQEGDISGDIVVTGIVDTNIASSYTLAYNVTDSAGNAATEVRRTVSVVEPSQAFGLDIDQPESGAIVASPSPNAPNSRYLAGTVVTLAYAGTGEQQVAVWNGATPDNSDPNRAIVVMDGAKFISVVLGDATGTVRVDVTPNNATWTVTDSVGGTHNGTGDSSVNVPTGDVSIAFNALEGYTAPSNQNDTVNAGVIVDFAGLYLEGNAFNLTAPRSLRGQPGDTIACPIAIDKGDIANYSFTIAFDDALVEVDRVEAGGATTSWGDPTVNASAGNVSVSANGPAIGSGGALATIYFTVKDEVNSSTSTELAFTNASLSDTKGTVDSISTNDGKLSIELGEFTWGDANADNQVNATDATMLLEYAVGARDHIPAFDEQDSSEGTGGADVSGEDPSVVGAYDAALVLQHFAQALGAFPADRNGDGLGPDLTEDKKSVLSGGQKLLADLDKSVARTVKITGSQTVNPNTSITVPIGIDVPDRVQSYVITIQYDPGVLQFDNVSKSQNTDTWLSPVIFHVPGTLKLASAGADTLQDAGSLANVSFLVNSNVGANTITELALADAVINDGNILVQTQDEVFAPEISKITPARGANFGGTVIAIQGNNLGDVDTVYFGGQPSSRIEFLPQANILTAVAPEGIGTVEVAVEALGQSSSLPNAFSYFEPDISVYPDPQEVATTGRFFDVPIVLGGQHAHSLTSVSFTLHYDARTFFLRRQANIEDFVFLGPKATRGVVTGEQVGRGEWRINIEANLGPGHICTVRFITSGRGTGESIMYVSDVDGS